MCIAGGKITDIKSGQSGLESRGANPPRAVRQFAAHTHLFFEGDDKQQLFVITSGWVKLYRTLIDGQRQVVGFANAGSILGLESDLDHANGCEAITAVTAYVIPVKSIADLCRHDGAFAEQLLRQVGRQLGAAQAQLASVGTQSADQKLATFLISIADLCGAEDGGEFDLPMRRGDMAEFLGLRLETVSRKMSEFQRRGWIVMTSLYHCRIARPDLLEELALGGEMEDFTIDHAA
jgi:CRP/FNR family transcriptional regulator